MRTRRRVAVVAVACAGLVVAATPVATQATTANTRTGRATPANGHGAVATHARTVDAAVTAAAGRDGAVVIRDIEIRVRHQRPVSAFLVRPGGAAPAESQAGVLWLHWLGQLHSDRTEFLAEAVSMAKRGVVSVLPQGRFPWSVAPSGTPQDLAKIARQTRAFRSALRRLRQVGAVDPSRVAIVGHDYGAMFGALVADRDSSVSALVLDAPDATWGNWFATYWLGYEGAQRRHYVELFRALDPVHHTGRLGASVLFQWAGEDVYVTPRTRDAYAASSPHARAILYPTADHQLTDAAAADRDAFLAAQLHLPAAP
jgi:dienelactone hydrolase